MYRLLRPLIFQLDPETVHEMSLLALKAGNALGLRRSVPQYPHLRQNLFGLGFRNPVGLAAGYDKDAEVIDAALGLGFGFAEAGTITPEPQPGNPRPRLFRLAEDEAIINRFGFNSLGAAAAIRALEHRQRNPGKAIAEKTSGIFGINIGANKTSSDRIADYVAGYKDFAPYADYITINISSPNTPGLRKMQSQGELEPLLAALDQTRRALEAEGGKTPPLLLKIAPDLKEAGLAGIIKTAIETRIDGLIVSNTTVSRPQLASRHRGETGGLSGRPLFDLSTKVLARAYRLAAGRLPLIGVGGIASAQGAYEKITAGASLVQIYSALVYQGPGLVRRINKELATILAQNGHARITHAVGVKAGEIENS